MYRVDREGALEQARAAEARWRAGRPLSPLDGVPVTIKENIYTRGDPAPIGTRANDDAPPQPADAPPAARLREAGCVILGKTTMPDYGMLSSGLSSLHGVTRNPWRLDRNPSGSSSGAGAACAAGYAPLHLGTDIGGSVRLPATHCGIFALKPSLGRVPIHPPYIGRVAGPMTRTRGRRGAADEHAGAAGRARLHVACRSRSGTSAGPGATIDPRQLKIGFLPDMGVGLAIDREVRAAAEAAATALASAGCNVESIRSFLTEEMLDGVCRFFEARSYNDYMQLPAARRAEGAAVHRRMVHVARRQVHRPRRDAGLQPGAGDARGRGRRPRQYDFLLSPTSPILPYEAELPAPGNDPHNALPHIAFTVPYNMSEQPAASINWSYSAEGLPIGVQIVGQRFDDAGVLRLARLIEKMRPPQRRPTAT